MKKVQEILDALKKQVEYTIRANSEELYKECLISLMKQEEFYKQKIVEVENKISKINKAKEDLDKMFIEGKLTTIEDVRNLLNNGSYV